MMIAGSMLLCKVADMAGVLSMVGGGLERHSGIKSCWVCGFDRLLKGVDKLIGVHGIGVFLSFRGDGPY
jgi:hypothetical protein